MPTMAQNPAFVAYALSTVVLMLNLSLLWAMSGGVRGKTKTALNPEDVVSVAKGAALVQADPPEVARVLRAHQNALVNIVPFVFLGLLFVLVNGPAREAQILFGAFTFFRVGHSISYLAGKQPWRSLTFLLGALTTLVLMVEVVRYLLS